MAKDEQTKTSEKAQTSETNYIQRLGQQTLPQWQCHMRTESARATIFWHVRANDIFCSYRMLYWIDNFECLIMAFSWVFALFSYLLQ
jgi:hypothetical protein